MRTRNNELNRTHQQRWYAQNKELQIQRNNANREKKLTWFIEYKRNLKCELCPESHIAALDFHHCDPKKKRAGINRLINNNNSLEVIQEEIQKCRVLCSNCHRKLHYEEKTGAWCNGSTRDLYPRPKGEA